MAQGTSRQDENLNTTSRPWSRLARELAAVGWPSFLLGGVATMLFFAFIDPLELQDATFPSWNLSRMSGYALGFFFFWGIALASSALTALLVRPVRRPPERD